MNKNNYKDMMEDLLIIKRKQLVNTIKEISEIEKELSKLNNDIRIVSPVACKTCGSDKVLYDTERLLLSYPPKFVGKCLECESINYINKLAYEELFRK